MSYNTRKDYRRQIILLIAEGKTNEQIWKAVGCNRKYPGIIRHELKAMSEAEQEALIEDAMGIPEQKKRKDKKEPVFKTPTMYAKGRYIRSGY